MPFDPSETDVEEYESAYTEGLVFEVNRLLPGRSQFSIELAIQKISRDIIRETSKGVETVTIYWGRLNSTSTTTRTEYHHGWCHIVCSSWMLKRALKMRLHYEELFPGTRKRVTTGAAAEPMTKFDRVTHLTPPDVKTRSPLGQNSATNQGQSRSERHATLIRKSSQLTEKIAAACQEITDYARWVAHRDHGAAELGYGNAALFEEVAKFVVDARAAITSSAVASQAPATCQPSSSTSQPVKSSKRKISLTDSKEGDHIR